MIFENALPLLIFLVVLFLAFYFVETIILLALNFYIHKCRDFVVDTLLRTIVRHRTLMRIAAFGSIAMIFVLLFCSTSLADLLMGGTGVLRFLALILIITMLMIYYIGIQNLSEVVIVRRIHLFVFIILSLFAFTGIMGLARNSYQVYQEAINRAFVKPIVDDIEHQYSDQLEDRLFKVFREKAKRGECEYYDYAEKNGTGFTQFVFIKKDPAMAEENPEIRKMGEALAGKNCVLETKFLLTPEGKWYEVLEQDIEAAD